MSDLVNGMLGKFFELSQEEKQLAADMETAHKEYNDYCADSEKDLNKKIDEIHEKMDKLNYFLDYAREHANISELEAATEPFDTPEGTLESIRQTIKLDSHSDPNAESLYTKATGKKLYYEQEIANTRKLIDGSKIQAKRQYDSEVAKLNKRKIDHFERVREYVQSRDFTEYLRYLVYDKSAFNSPGTVELNDDEHISLGQRRVKLSVPMEIEQDLALNSKGEYNAAARTIGAPFQISVKKGGTLFLEHDDRNGQYLLGGIQRLLLNFIKYYGANLTSVLFCDPEGFDVESLGNISALGKGINPFITVPKSMDEITGKVTKLVSKLETAPIPDKVSRILVMRNFPEKYTPDIMHKVLDMCKNAENTGLLVILTHKVPMEVTPIEKEVRAVSDVVRSRNGGFWIEKLHESLFWYSAPSDLSDEVRKEYVEKRRQDALNAAQTPAPTEEPIPEPVDEPVKPVENIVTTPTEEPVQPAENFVPEPVEDLVQPTDDIVSSPVNEPVQPVEDIISSPVDEPIQPMEDIVPAPVNEPEHPAEDTLSTVNEAARIANDIISSPIYDSSQTEDDSVVDNSEQYDDIDMSEPAGTDDNNLEEPIDIPNIDDTDDSDMTDVSDDDNDVQIPAHILFANQQPDPEPEEVSMTVVSELNDQLAPPYNPFEEEAKSQREPEQLDPDMTYRITDKLKAKNPEPVAPQVEREPVQQIEPDMTYRITDKIKANTTSEPVAPKAEREPVQQIEPDMTYRITDKIKANTTSEPVAPKAEREPVQQIEPDMTYRITDKIKANTTSEPVAPKAERVPVQQIEPDMTYRITDKIKANTTSEPVVPKAEREPVQQIEPDMTYRITDKIKANTASEPVATKAEHEPVQQIEPDMTYRITDHRPAKEPEHVPVVEKTRNPIKEVLGAGKRKIEAFVDNRKGENPFKKVNSVSEEHENISNLNSETSEPVRQEPVSPVPEPNPVVENKTVTYHEEKPVEKVVETVPPKEERRLEKGVRKLPEIPIGKTVDGNPVNLNIDGNITYICGKRGDERKTLTERVIAHIMADTHPDDVELWMFDCGNGEFMKYAENPAAHIKYLVSDTGAETSLDFVDVIDTEMERRIEAFDENGWSSVDDIPKDVYMPIIVVAVNSFPRFSENIGGTSKYFGRNYNGKLTKLFKNCVNYGIHFLLIGSEFSEDGKRPSCLEGCVVHSAVVVSGKDLAAHKLFSSIRLYDNEIESLKKIPAGCAFTADENSTNGLTLVRITSENVENNNSFNAVSEYTEEIDEYVDKNPFIGDKKTPKRFDDRREYREEQINNRAEDECLLFLGEPCRFMGEYPVRLYDDFGENILAIAPAREKNNAALMVRAALRSLEEQGIIAEILACRSNPVYTELENCDELENITIYEGSKAESRIKELSDMIDKGERPNVFEIVLGGDLLVASMHADDMIGVLKNVLVKGPRLGTHFLFISGSAAQAATGFLSLFRHKIVFACPYSEAEKILREPNCDLPENGFRLSNDYDELTILPYSM